MGYEIRNIVLVIIVMAILSFSLTVAFGDLMGKYNVQQSERYYDIYHRINQSLDTTYQLSGEASLAVRNKTSTETTAEANYLTGALSGLRIFWDSVNTAAGLVGVIATELRIPPFIVRAIITLISVIAAFAILYAIILR